MHLVLGFKWCVIRVVEFSFDHFMRAMRSLPAARLATQRESVQFHHALSLTELMIKHEPNYEPSNDPRIRV
jgi:hypothetical protein